MRMPCALLTCKKEEASSIPACPVCGYMHEGGHPSSS